jgi:hypothetical protein
MGCAGSKALPIPNGKDGIPLGFPAKAERRLFINWDQSTTASGVLMCSPKDENELLMVVNWAALAGFTVRATGIKHNWSPITIVSQGPDKDLDKVILVSLMEHMNKVDVIPAADGNPPMAKVQLGCNQIDFLTALEKGKGGNGDIGYGIVHTPAPDSITMGGMLAIDGHGTSIPCPSEAAFIDPKTATYGTYSNRMLACRAVVFDEAKKAYVVKEFKRGQNGEIAPFLAHVGRALLTEATLQIEPNYYMRCQSFMDISWQEMFPATTDPAQPAEKSMAWYLRNCGRAEAIWFPFTDNPWLKVWTVTGPEMPKGSRKVDNACNYPFSDDLGDNITKFFRSFVGADADEKDHLIKEILDAEEQRLGDKEQLKENKSAGRQLLKWIDDVTTEIADSTVEVIGGPKMTPLINKLVWARCAAGLMTTDSDDIWGPSKNTLIYVKDSTLRVTANGYAVMTNVDHVQQCMYAFTQLYKKLLDKYAAEDKYPIACPLEIRVTGVDDPTPIGGDKMDAETPPLSALSYDAEAKQNNWNVALWLDVLSIPGAAFSNEFYVEMEDELMKDPIFNGVNGRIRPEWSKGWGYSKDGPWRSEKFRMHTRKTMPAWDETIGALNKHDKNGLFTNPWMKDFFVPIAEAKDSEAKPPTDAKLERAPDPAPTKPAPKKGRADEKPKKCDL